MSLDYSKIYKLASIFCDVNEIADILEVPKWQIQQDTRAMDLIDKGKSQAKTKIRALLFKNAEKNAQSAIFLAKNYLGMSDEGLSEKLNDINITIDFTENKANAEDDILLLEQEIKEDLR